MHFSSTPNLRHALPACRDLRFTQLTGPIPDGLGSMDKLRYLSVADYLNVHAVVLNALRNRPIIGLVATSSWYHFVQVLFSFCDTCVAYDGCSNCYRYASLTVPSTRLLLVSRARPSTPCCLCRCSNLQQSRHTGPIPDSICSSRSLMTV
jgi:hypothetical protein